MAVNRVLVPTAAGYKYTRDRTSLLSDKFSTDGMEMQLPQYQYQSTPVPSIGNVCRLGLGLGLGLGLERILKSWSSS